MKGRERTAQDKTLHHITRCDKTSQGKKKLQIIIPYIRVKIDTKILNKIKTS